jgi:hypothetical protein
MSDLEALELLFNGGKVSDGDGDSLSFKGTLWMYADGISALENQLGYRVPTGIAAFLQCFGGTKLFINSYGGGTQILPIGEITSRNLALQEADDPFWPMFAILGFDSMDNMLCMYNQDGKVHFGNLDHEAWGCSEVWASEAMAFAPFDKWLRMFIESKGDTLPGKDIAYEI